MLIGTLLATRRWPVIGCDVRALLELQAGKFNRLIAQSAADDWDDDETDEGTRQQCFQVRRWRGRVAPVA